MRSFDDAWSALASGVRLGRGSFVRRGGARRVPERLLELWEFEACPFCRKVREGLSELDLEYVSHPCARGSNNRERTPPSGDGKRSYPHLFDPNTGASMRESEDILDYLHATYGAGRPAIRRRIAPLDTAGSTLASVIRPLGGVARPGARDRVQPAELLVLYQFEGCPYCRKVRERLASLNLDAWIKNVAKGSPRRAEVVRHGRMKVPFLIDPNTGAALYESDAICAYLEAQYG